MSIILLIGKILSILKNILILPLIRFVYVFFEALIRLIFYKVIVRFYASYLSLTNKIGWSKIRGNFLNFIFGQKLVHVVVVIITFSLVFTNIAQGTKADILSGGNPRPIISHIVGSEFGEIENGLNYEEAFSSEELNLGMKQSYLDDQADIKNKLKIDQDSFDEESLATNNTFDNDNRNISDIPQVAVNTSQVKRDGIVGYVVESGDTISTIARKFDISVNTVLWENNLSAYSVIRPGDKLSILPETGTTHIVKSGDTLGAIANSNDVEIDKILEANGMNLNSKLSVGQKLIIPDGTKIVAVASVAKTVKSYTGIEAIKDIVSSEPQQTAANKMAWPTVGNRITQYFSWRHTGLDIANKTGTPLFAADAGTVEFAGWSNGYGNNIVINHGGGKKTRYAHMSKFYVSKGDEVTKGETIGEMGSTGWSTGPHIHFEVIIDGVKYNPLNYIR